MHVDFALFKEGVGFATAYHLLQNHACVFLTTAPTA
jgi:hypothetical protein